MTDTEELLRLARHTIMIEAKTVEGLLPSLDESFEKLIRTIYDAQGRLVVTGVGKSAIVGQKIVATLNSTGTPALFMHAADAIHGDLGMIGKDDIVICLSKSGETPEIKMLVPLVRNLGNKLVAMVSNPNSTLAGQADHIIPVPVEKEADPNNLAPTASTTAQMAMGDAIAIALLSLRGFTQKDFARYHPGGSLGRQMYLKVSDVYPQNSKPSVSPDTNIRQTILSITGGRLGATVVTDPNDLILGIITDGDLRRMLETEGDVSGLTANDIMSKNPRTVAPDDLAMKAFSQMRDKSITQLIVASEGQYLGLIHLHDLIREGFI